MIVYIYYSSGWALRNVQVTPSNYGHLDALDKHVIYIHQNECLRESNINFYLSYSRVGCRRLIVYFLPALSPVREKLHDYSNDE